MLAPPSLMRFLLLTLSVAVPATTPSALGQAATSTRQLTTVSLRKALSAIFERASMTSVVLYSTPTVRPSSSAFVSPLFVRLTVPFYPSNSVLAEPEAPLCPCVSLT